MKNKIIVCVLTLISTIIPVLADGMPVAIKKRSVAKAKPIAAPVAAVVEPEPEPVAAIVEPEPEPVIDNTAAIEELRRAQEEQAAINKRAEDSRNEQIRRENETITQITESEPVPIAQTTKKGKKVCLECDRRLCLWHVFTKLFGFDTKH